MLIGDFAKGNNSGEEIVVKAVDDGIGELFGHVDWMVVVFGYRKLIDQVG